LPIARQRLRVKRQARHTGMEPRTPHFRLRTIFVLGFCWCRSFSASINGSLETHAGSAALLQTLALKGLGQPLVTTAHIPNGTI